MAKLKKDLQAVTRELKALTKKTERLLKMAGKLEKDQAARAMDAAAAARAAPIGPAMARTCRRARSTSSARAMGVLSSAVMRRRS